jgi:lipopolysaccharide transport system ATP-binding protein
MGNYAVEVVGLGKEYKIGKLQTKRETFAETVLDSLSAPFRRAGNLLRGQAYGAAELSESIWALKDVDFKVKHGEVVGIIGRNGAGKSTLLKILSSITEPTEGYVDLEGRVGALLEVGTGFHQELTGRENVYLNGAILGMGRQEIDRKFDEIVDFAGVEKFIDTPVKHYSSGMGLRLGFAVAAHLEPEILVVDEVLAVGDAEFQKKCLGKMSDVAGEGRTVLFVSHNMGAVQSLCTRAVLLEHGMVRCDDQVDTVIEQYLSIVFDKGSAEENVVNDVMTVYPPLVTSEIGAEVSAVRSGENVRLVFKYQTEPSLKLINVRAGITCLDQMGVLVFTQTTKIKGIEFPELPEKGEFICLLKEIPLPASNYRINLTIKANEEKIVDIENCIELRVVEGDFYGTGYTMHKRSGLTLVDADWDLLAIDADYENLR